MTKGVHYKYRHWLFTQAQLQICTGAEVQSGLIVMINKNVVHCASHN